MSAHRLLALSLGVALVLLVATSGAQADIVHLTDGRTVEGKIVAETTDYVEVRQRYGTIKIDRKEIKRIEAVVSKTEQYERMLKEAHTLDELRRLVTWCDENDVAGSEARKRVEDEELALKKARNPDWCRVCDARGIVNCASCKAQGTIAVPCEACGRVGKLPCHACPDSGGRVRCAGCAGDLKVLVPCPPCGGSGARTCGGCSGDGKVRCNGCSGSGYRTEYYDEVITDALGRRIGTRRATRQVLCPACNGTGALGCTQCAGAGRLPCAPCGTKGKVVIVCPTCRGSGTTACTSCRGSGALDCPKCKDGANVVTCDRCRGKRRTKCESCGGRGIGSMRPSAPSAPSASAQPAGR